MHGVMNVWEYMDILDVKVGALSLYIFMDMSSYIKYTWTFRVLGEKEFGGKGMLKLSGAA